MKLEIRNEILNHNLMKLYVHREINETTEMTFKIETKLDTWHINSKFKKKFWKKNFFWKKIFEKKKKFLKIFFFKKKLSKKKKKKNQKILNIKWKFEINIKTCHTLKLNDIWHEMYV